MTKPVKTLTARIRKKTPNPTIDTPYTFSNPAYTDAKKTIDSLNISETEIKWFNQKVNYTINSTTKTEQLNKIKTLRALIIKNILEKQGFGISTDDDDYYNFFLNNSGLDKGSIETLFGKINEKLKASGAETIEYVKQNLVNKALEKNLNEKELLKKIENLTEDDLILFKAFENAANYSEISKIIGEVKNGSNASYILSKAFFEKNITTEEDCIKYTNESLSKITPYKSANLTTEILSDATESDKLTLSQALLELVVKEPGTTEETTGQAKDEFKTRKNAFLTLKSYLEEIKGVAENRGRLNNSSFNNGSLLLPKNTDNRKQKVIFFTQEERRALNNSLNISDKENNPFGDDDKKLEAVKKLLKAIYKGDKSGTIDKINFCDLSQLQSAINLFTYLHSLEESDLQDTNKVQEITGAIKKVKEIKKEMAPANTTIDDNKRVELLKFILKKKITGSDSEIDKIKKIPNTDYEEITKIISDKNQLSEVFKIGDIRGELLKQKAAIRIAATRDRWNDNQIISDLSKEIHLKTKNVAGTTSASDISGILVHNNELKTTLDHFSKLTEKIKEIDDNLENEKKLTKNEKSLLLEAILGDASQYEMDSSLAKVIAPNLSSSSKLSGSGSLSITSLPTPVAAGGGGQSPTPVAAGGGGPLPTPVATGGGGQSPTYYDTTKILPWLVLTVKCAASIIASPITLVVVVAKHATTRNEYKIDRNIKDLGSGKFSVTSPEERSVELKVTQASNNYTIEFSKESDAKKFFARLPKPKISSSSDPVQIQLSNFTLSEFESNKFKITSSSSTISDIVKGILEPLYIALDASKKGNESIFENKKDKLDQTTKKIAGNLLASCAFDFAAYGAAKFCKFLKLETPAVMLFSVAELGFQNWPFDGQTANDKLHRSAFKKEATREINSIKSKNHKLIDERKPDLSGSLKTFTAASSNFLNGAVGMALSTIALIPEAVSDATFSASKKCNDLAKTGKIAKIAYAGTAIFGTIGVAFKVPAFVLDSIGNGLSQGLDAYNDLEKPVTCMSYMAQAKRAITDTKITNHDYFLNKQEKKFDFAKNIDRSITDSNLQEIAKAAKKSFEKDPSAKLKRYTFKKEKEYLYKATNLDYQNKSYNIFYNPKDGSVVIAYEQKSLANLAKTNEFPVEVLANKTDFTNKAVGAINSNGVNNNNNNKSNTNQTASISLSKASKVISNLKNTRSTSIPSNISTNSNAVHEISVRDKSGLLNKTYKISIEQGQLTDISDEKKSLTTDLEKLKALTRIRDELKLQQEKAQPKNANSKQNSQQSSSPSNSIKVTDVEKLIGQVKSRTK